MEPKRSCCSLEICCGMRVEKACFVFAIINAVILTAGFLCSLGFFGLMLSYYLDLAPHGDQTLEIFFLILSAVCVVGTAIADVFAVLLCLGISQKKPRFVMTYLVFGMIVEIFSVIGIISFVWTQWGLWELIMYYGVTSLGVCVVYAFLLLLVKQAYMVIADIAPTVHRKLINNPADF